ncbi:bifunctional acetate--CoA ligase family protein/GNAT family N-acetyltransferase [Thermomonas sp.]|uniref:bifunctional acetate--CoA ligase family protein/GNAT family N-acetyltransferase n=1 Tax=Thermomonas sp. TaxID=1971895 RepID=UPI002B68D874|nr:bifunctional acetate--CoA ligase family protein/GNAT family N-acetyltransferase [Thermomonas sp.]HRO64344.1 bifunctional acetate--CoA ligase family protein/GNAT family N-acetyltransferase [Thermomonas sp.]HRP72551.1 bifunctional acetate--CoA ligase family protein/GNAT family N-acetyltransferase [Luteimonas sp.]
MSTYRLESIFQPASLAVVGGSARARSAGRAVMRNLRESGYAGKIGWVSPGQGEIDGIATVPRLRDLPWVPDLAILTAPPAIVPQLVEEAAVLGVGASVLLTADTGEGRAAFHAAIEQAARPRGMRILGPHCLGILSSPAKLNASIAARTPQAGDVALVSESSAIAAALVEWGVTRAIGFSRVVALGDGLDVDFADLLDYLATDPHTRSILLYVENVGNARKFMSAARAAARAKPVVVVRAARPRPAQSFSEIGMRALAPTEAVHAAAFRRAGLLQVDALDELFAAAETLSTLHTFPGRRLAILGNGGGVGLLAAQQLQQLGGTLATLSADTVAALDGLLDCGWSHENPVDIVVDADGARYATAVEALLADPGNDALMVINVPTAFSAPMETAGALTGALARRKGAAARKPVFAVWLTDDDQAHAALHAARVPSYDTETEAVHGFMHLVRYREAQQALMETPPSLPRDFTVDAATARALVGEAVARGEVQLDPQTTARILAAYGLDYEPPLAAADAETAVRIAEPLLAAGRTVAVKIDSGDIAHKTEVDGVRLNLASAQAVRDAATDVLRLARERRPDARIRGVIVQPMARRPDARELIAAIADDPVFGPVVVFGRGGTAVRVVEDLAHALPPLDLRLAHELIGRTRVSRRLKAHRNEPAANEREVALALVKLAQLAADVPQIQQMSLNPLLADADGVVAVDARILVGPVAPLHKGRGHPRFAILPYPSEWERDITLASGAPASVRPVRPEDEDLFREFFTHVTDEDLRLRFFQSVKHFSHEFIARLTQMDYARSMALVALDADGAMLGAVRLHADANYRSGEYGILVRSDLKGQGLGWQLMTIMIEVAGWLGLREVEGQVLRQNRSMLAMCEQLGFQISPDPDEPGLMIVKLPVSTNTETAP